MTVKQFVEVKEQIIESDSKTSRRPTKLLIHLHFLVDCEKSSDQDVFELPINFPVNWIAQTLDVGNVKLFCLKFNTLATTIT